MNAVQLVDGVESVRITSTPVIIEGWHDMVVILLNGKPDVQRIESRHAAHNASPHGRLGGFVLGSLLRIPTSPIKECRPVLNCNAFDAR